MEQIEILQRKLKEAFPQFEPGTKKLALSREQRHQLLDETIVPALRRIEPELKQYRLQARVTKFASATAALEVKDRTSIFYFKIHIDNIMGALHLSFTFTDEEIKKKIIEEKWFGSFIREDKIRFGGKYIDLTNRDEITQENIIATFVEYYFNRQDITRKEIKELAAKNAELKRNDTRRSEESRELMEGNEHLFEETHGDN